jgi:hypothetical protein
MQQAMYRARKAGKPVPQHDSTTHADSEEALGSARRGPRYAQFCHEGWPERLMRGELTQKEASEQFQTNPGNVSRWMAAYVIDNAGNAKAFTADKAVKEAASGPLVEFREEFFPDRSTPPFQAEWAELLEETIASSGKTLLLAPQRYGKSTMLIDLCIQMIIERPNISIGWVSKTADLAETMVGYIRQVLEHDTELIEKVLGDHKQFVPPARSGLPWTNGKFTTGQRTVIRKGATMESFGVGGTVVGRDFDVIVVDDMQDRISALSPTKREKDSEWFFTDMNSRKEEHTALFFICSRQHEDDVPGRIMRDHADDWRIRVYQSHDPACLIDERHHDDHQESDCLLWPEKRTHKWLMSQKRANPPHFERNFQNNPSTDNMTYLTAADLEDRRDPTFFAGTNPGGRLVCGIDPASAKPSVGVLWAYRDGKRHLVDSKTASPGTQGVREIIAEFRATYGCSRFIVESNGYQKEIVHDSQLKAMVVGLKIQVIPQFTSRMNKWDAGSGVVAMLHGLSDPEGHFVLPSASGGDRDVRDRLDMLYREWLLFDPDFANSKHAKDDLTMASWIPQSEMDRFDRNVANQVVYLEDRTSYGSTSYGAQTSYARN